MQCSPVVAVTGTDAFPIFFSFLFFRAGDMVVVVMVSSEYGRLGKTPRTLDIRPCTTHAGAAAGGRRSLGWVGV